MALGLLVAAVTLGSLGGTTVGARARRTGPERLILLALAGAATAAAVATAAFGLGTAIGVVAVAGITSALGKLALDAVLQRDVPEQARGRAFARAETTLQLAWVGGGGLGLALPLDAALGLGLVTAALAGVLVGTLTGLRGTAPPRERGSARAASGR
jgi:hypothetical protein